MDPFSGYIWIFLSKLVQTLFWPFPRIIMRYCSHEALNSGCSSNLCHENYQTESNNSGTKTEAEAGCSKCYIDAELKCEIFEESNDTIQFQLECRHQNDSNGSENVTNYAGILGLQVEETTKLVFKFQYQTWNCSEEFKACYSENFDSVNIDSDKSSSLLDEQEPPIFTFKEPCVGSKDFHFENYSDFLSERIFEPESCESVSMQQRSPIISIGDEVLLETDFGTTIELDTLGNHDEENAALTKENLDFGSEKNTENLYDVDRDTMNEIRKLEETRMQTLEMEKSKGYCFQDKHRITLHGSKGSDIEDSHKFDAQWEHQDLIEQLKMELNKVRAIGLPTIIENCESPRIMEDLKSWKIDEKFQHSSTTNELPKLYKSYTERMRNFDILNYQKLYAIGSFKSEDLLQSFSSHENTFSAITSFLPHIFHHCRNKKSEPGPLKFMREFYGDLEEVYVGQLCLSWEFLQWEYEKALELCESDQYRLQSYNEVAEEFQQFQVLLQRFIENEPFQGPRVEYYVRNRCVMRNLLQIPVIREDSTKEEKKSKTRDEDKDEITSDMLIEILEESIRIIWLFIRADKDASSLTHKGPRETQLELQDPADSEFLMEIQAELQKKEKKLSEFSKSRSSILKKFLKHEKDGRDHFLYFSSLVIMKLVWRVLKMSKISRDQLVWCHNKLNSISFINRKINIEPSFLLFPC
ncbi:uncharacterized protein LOC113867624 [Abrus precatorius]|uniref:Uncharacterized protein LOC113867624 n=1 Tax=Abrus precatorius TaxID=3816 RepID=A0A8B8LRB7_ABRPR|nr:uncharacterized protein LOC113867624 [Abrus precatorius]